jgi:protoheme IX farnesyltransferase
MLPYTVQMFGEIYLISALLLGLIFLVYSFRLYRDATNALAMPTFAYSIFYLAALFAAMLIDHFIYL